MTPSRNYLKVTKPQRHREKHQPPSVATFNMLDYVFQHSRIKISGIIANFAVADRLAEAPVWGKAERDVVKIHKKAFIRADS